MAYTGIASFGLIVTKECLEEWIKSITENDPDGWEDADEDFCTYIDKDINGEYTYFDGDLAVLNNVFYPHRLTGNDWTTDCGLVITSGLPFPDPYKGVLKDRNDAKRRVMRALSGLCFPENYDAEDHMGWAFGVAYNEDGE